MNEKIIRYEHWRRESGIFDFPFQLCYTLFLQHFHDYPHDNQTKQFLDDLLASSGEDIILVKNRRPNPMSYIAATLIEQGVGKVYCQICKKNYYNQEVVVERGYKSQSSLQGGEERRFYCINGHTLLAVTDLRA
jgi:hypothetical protein